MSGWEPDFDTYLRTGDHPPASFMVDLAAARHAPIDTHALRVQIRITLQAPDGEGLRSDSEAPLVHALEDRIIEGLSKRCGAIFVGHELFEGHVHLVFYAPAHRVEGAAEGDWLDWLEDDGYEVAWLTERDPEWSTYFDHLFPDPGTLQAIQNRRLLDQLASHGDDPSRPRLVDHVALFADEASATRAGDPLRAAGFEVDAPEADEDAWVLQFRRIDHLSEGRANEFCAEIDALIASAGGHYDGWGCPVVTGGEGSGRA